jgi:DNA repair protein RadD
MLIPHPFQRAAIDSLYHYFRIHSTGNPLIALPTGTGKSVVIACFLDEVLKRYPSQRILIVTHRKELIVQNYNEHKGIWPESPSGIYSASVGKVEHQYPITFCGIQSVAKRANLFNHVDLVIIDEAHLVSTNTETQYRSFINQLTVRNPYLRVIGLSATCWRMGHGMLTANHIFTDICFDLTTLRNFNWLIEEGYLCPVIPFQTREHYDLSTIRITGGEYNQGEMQLQLNKDDINRRVLTTILEQGSDRQSWLIFTTGIEHSERVADLLCSNFGIKATAVHSKMLDRVRDQKIQDFKDGKYKCLVNNDLLTTGFNHPPVDLIAVMRPTQSSSLWVQMLGRGTRTSPGKKNCLVLDFARNTERLGPINDPVIPPPPGERKRDKGIMPIKICPSCSCYNHPSVGLCENCGYEFPKDVNLTSKASTLELIRQVVEPVVKSFTVRHVTYSRHTARGTGLTSFKISYYCNSGATIFHQYLGFEHVPFVRRRAVHWWEALQLNHNAAPETVAEALGRTGELAKIVRIDVNVAPKYPEIEQVHYKHGEEVLSHVCSD